MKSIRGMLKIEGGSLKEISFSQFCGHMSASLLPSKKCLGKNKLKFTQGFSTRVTLFPVSSQLGTLGCHVGGHRGNTTGIWWVEARNAAQPPTVHRAWSPSPVTGTERRVGTLAAGDLYPGRAPSYQLQFVQ